MSPWCQYSLGLHLFGLVNFFRREWEFEGDGNILIDSFKGFQEIEPFEISCSKPPSCCLSGMVRTGSRAILPSWMLYKFWGLLVNIMDLVWVLPTRGLSVTVTAALDHLRCLAVAAEMFSSDTGMWEEDDYLTVRCIQLFHAQVCTFFRDIFMNMYLHRIISFLGWFFFWSHFISCLWEWSCTNVMQIQRTNDLTSSHTKEQYWLGNLHVVTQQPIYENWENENAVSTWSGSVCL